MFVNALFSYEDRLAADVIASIVCYNQLIMEKNMNKDIKQKESAEVNDLHNICEIAPDTKQTKDVCNKVNKRKQPSTATKKINK